MILLTGCILPPPVGVDTADNTPPVLDLNTMVPRSADITLNTNCQRCTFTLNVIDPDPDTLFMRAYYDFAVTPTPVFGCDLDFQAAEGNAARVPITCTINPSTLIRVANEGQPKAFEIWVTDRDFASGGTQQLAEGAGSVVARWTVTGERRGVTCDGPDNMGCSATP